MIGRFRRKSSEKSVFGTVCALLLVALVIGGCGGDDASPTEPAATAPTETETAPVPAETETEAGTETEAETETETEAEAEPEPGPGTEAESPEDQRGGAGDEEPARTLALFTGRGGTITPRVVRVPAFISIRVELRSADGAPYGLDFGEFEIKSGGRIGSRARTLNGLRPQEGIVGRPIASAGNSVRIEATAEPGP